MPLKRSLQAFSYGNSGLIWIGSIPVYLSQVLGCLAMTSEPFLEQMKMGFCAL